MKILLSTIGSRGDVQPILALALELKALGHAARLVVPTNFKDWIESYGLECTPIGPDLKKLTGGSVPGKPVLPSKEQLQKMADESVRDQFRVIGEAARGCDLIVAATALQFAARSIADLQQIPYVFAAYCPVVLPSPKYPPPVFGVQVSFSLPEETNLRLWQENEEDFYKFAPAINEERANVGLNPVPGVRPYMFTNRPWLAADPVLAPAYPADGLEIVQTGAWMLPRAAPDASLPEDLERFLSAGTPPIYLGFGSMRASDQTGEKLIEATRALGLRAVLSQGWAGLAPGDTGDDCITIGEVDYQALFPRVAAVVHHGGAGTTQTAALAGRPQVIVPHNYDQFYWAHRVQQLGIGVSGPTRDELTTNALVAALRECLHPEVAARAKAMAVRMEPRGARIAAERLAAEFG